MSKVAYQDETGLKFIIENPDNKMRQEIADRLRAGWEKEYSEFLEEVSVTVRRMPNGTRIVKSKPLEIKIVKDDKPVSDSIKDLEPLPTRQTEKGG